MGVELHKMVHCLTGGALGLFLLLCLSCVPEVSSKNQVPSRNIPGTSRASLRRFFDGRRRRNSDFCFNGRYNTRTEPSDCEYDCCWGDSCGTEGECRKAVIIGAVIGSVILLSICACIFWCFFRKKLCFQHRGGGDCHGPHHHHQQPVTVAQPVVYTGQPQPGYTQPVYAQQPVPQYAGNTNAPPPPPQYTEPVGVKGSQV